jgi:hypothetical protein
LVSDAAAKTVARDGAFPDVAARVADDDVLLLPHPPASAQAAMPTIVRASHFAKILAE